MAEDVVQHLESAAKKKNITVSLDGSPVMVNGVRNVIYEMLFNIADNAIRYTDLKGTVKISLGMQRRASVLLCRRQWNRNCRG